MIERGRSRGAHLLIGAIASAVLACSDGTSIDAVQPDLEVEETVDFGDVQIGIDQPYALMVRNSGDGVLTVTDIERGNNFAGEGHEFAVSPVNFTLAPDQTQEVTVRFLPFVATEGLVRSSLKIVTNATNNGQPIERDVDLVARGVRHGIEVVPNPIDFGNVLIGSARTLSVEIYNRLSVATPLFTEVDEDGRALLVNQGGLGRFELMSPQLEPGSRSLLPEGEMLEPDENIVVVLRYVPDPAQGDREDMGRWTIGNCDRPLCNLDVPLVGRGTNEAIACTPPSLDFGQVNPGATVTGTVACANIANEPVTLLSWELAPGTASAYGVVSSSGQARTLPPNETFSIALSFSPTQADVGRSPTGALLIKGSNPQAQRNLDDTRVTLVGEAGGPNIVVTPDTLAFGQVAVGTAKKRRVLVTNLGFDDLSVSRIDPDASGTGLFVADQTTLTIPPGGAEFVEVTLTVTDAGVIDSELVIESDDADEPVVTIPLSGEGVVLPPCQYTVAPTQLGFGVVEVLRSIPQGLRVQNVGTDDCLVSDVEVLAGSDRSFSLIEAPPASLTLAAGETLTVLVDYTPRDVGNHTGELGFYISDPNDSNPRVALSGEGAESVLLISPNEIDFGLVEPGCSTRARTVTVYNTGATNTYIDRIELPPGVTSEFIIENIPAGVPGPPGAPIAPGASIELSVRYAPSAIGADTGYFHLYESGATTPYVVPLFGEGAKVATNEDHFEQLETPEVDILFVIDNSCSMSAEQASLTQNFDSFIAFAEAQALDYRIAVVSTDGDACPNPPPADRPPGMAQGRCGYFADGSASGQTDPDWRLITPDEQPSPAAAFRAIATQGINGSGAERGLQAAYNALSSPRITGWNAGFLRPDAYLALIFIADEDDQSLNTVDFFVNYFRAIKGFRNTNLFSASAIVGDVPNGCASGDPGFRYVDTAQQTGGVVESICTTDWAVALENLGLSVFGYKSRFFLSNQPIPASVQVLIDGVPVAATSMTGQVRWTYDDMTNSLNFAPLAIPEPGSEIVITYRAECL
jgi:hypothetical protein